MIVSVFVFGCRIIHSVFGKVFQLGGWGLVGRVQAYSSITVNDRILPPSKGNLPFREQTVLNTSATNNKTKEHTAALYTCFPAKWIRGEMKSRCLLSSWSTLTTRSSEPFLYIGSFEACMFFLFSFCSDLFISFFILSFFLSLVLSQRFRHFPSFYSHFSFHFIMY